jgi:hypothetical protein
VWLADGARGLVVVGVQSALHESSLLFVTGRAWMCGNILVVSNEVEEVMQADTVKLNHHT